MHFELLFFKIKINYFFSKDLRCDMFIYHEQKFTKTLIMNMHLFHLSII